MHTVTTSPWPYIVVDNFLATEDFKALSDRPISHVKPLERESLLSNEVHADGRIVAKHMPQGLVARIHAHCHERSLGWLNHLAPAKMPLYEYADYELVITGANCKFPIHADTWDKLLSIVVYLAPQQNAGTIVYDNRHGRNPINIEWKQNRALIFSRQEGKTWHGYKGDGKNNRLALVYNLMTSDRRGVYQAEGLSYEAMQLKRYVGKLGNLFGHRKARPV